MKRISLLLACGFGLSSSLYAANAHEVDTLEIEAPVDKIYIPVNFDDNDNVEVVLQGKFPNSCYKIGQTEAQIDPLSKRVMVRATSYVSTQELCLQSIVPFIQTVKLGLLPEGHYEVVYEKNRDIKKSLAIARRKTESADDFLYATVEKAFIDVNFETGKQALKLEGHFPYFFIGCMVIKEVRSTRTQDDILLVQPIAEIVDNESCSEQRSDLSFEYTSGLPEPFIGQGLLHVRTMNGNSLNQFLNIP